MVDESIIATIRHYLAQLPAYGIHSRRAVLFGSYARGEARKESDIDLVVIAPEFDHNRDIESRQRLWVATGDADDRIEPIACGEREWEEDDSRLILEIARQEGIMIAA
jgi:uncharacterized protein